MKIFTSPYTVVTSVVLRTKTKCCFVGEPDFTSIFSFSVTRNLTFMWNSKPTTPLLVSDVTIFTVLGGSENKVFYLIWARFGCVRLNSLVPPYVDLLGLGGLACRARLIFSTNIFRHFERR